MDLFLLRALLATSYPYATITAPTTTKQLWESDPMFTRRDWHQKMWCQSLLLPHRLIHILSQRTRTCRKETVSATSLNSQCVQNSRAHPNIAIIAIDTNNQNDLRRVLLVKTETTDSRRQLQTISHHRNRDPRQSRVAEN